MRRNLRETANHRDTRDALARSAAKAYLAANPPKLDIELRELGLDDESSGVKLPATLEEALVEAKLNARPSRAPRRPGVQAMTTFAYAAPQVKDEVIA